MKRGFIILFVAIAFVCFGTFLFIPSSITVSGYKIINVPSSSAGRLFERGADFKKWWPGEIINNSNFSYQNIDYKIKNSNILGITISAEIGELVFVGTITSIPINKDSSAFQLQYQPIATSLNPIKRIQYYFKALIIKKQLTSIITSLKDYAANTKNIYGLDIYATKVEDSSLISVKRAFDNYPNIKDIDGLINQLKQFATNNGGIIKNYPMLNIHINDDKKYEAMVAIPLLRDIAVKGDVTIKKMILGNILQAKITGGNAAINNGLNTLKDYAKDYGKVSPAIPFQLMITDRNKEPDTTKWVTLVKYPIF
jgi:hypothetical protein